MKKKVFVVGLLISFIIMLLVLTGCSSNDNNNNTNNDSNDIYDQASSANSDLAQIEVKEKLDIAYTAIQSEFLVESALDSSLTFADYCTQSKLQENLDNAILNSLVWNENVSEGTITYNGETFSFTLSSEGEVSVTNSEE